MTFKLLKRRYRSMESSEKLRRLDYFNQPFESNSEIRLIDDIYLDKPLALESLATIFQPVDDKKGTQNAIQRPKDEKKKKNNAQDEILDFEPFNTNQSSNF